MWRSWSGGWGGPGLDAAVVQKEGRTEAHPKVRNATVVHTKLFKNARLW